MNILVPILLGPWTPLLPAVPDDFVDVDFAKVERKIAKEPKYVGAPLYALFIFDRQAKSRVWAVLDKSKTDLEYYDVLYFDKNGNEDSDPS